MPHRHVPSECVDEWGDLLECTRGKADIIIPLELLSYILLVGFIVPLGMLCCCSRNPHKVWPCVMDCPCGAVLLVFQVRILSSCTAMCMSGSLRRSLHCPHVVGN